MASMASLFENIYQKGFQKGYYLESRKIAARMLLKGESIEEIAEVTGLEIDEVREIEAGIRQLSPS